MLIYKERSCISFPKIGRKVFCFCKTLYCHEKWEIFSDWHRKRFKQDKKEVRKSDADNLRTSFLYFLFTIKRWA